MMSIQSQLNRFRSTLAFRIMLHVGFWLLFLSSPLYTYVTTDSFGPAGIATFALLNLAYLPFYYFLAYFMIPFFFGKKKWWLFIPATCALYLIFILTTRGIETLCMPHLKTQAEITIYARALQRNIFYIPEFLQMAIVTTIPLAIKSQRRYYKLMQKQSELIQVNTELELNFLKSQLNPHFLFNTLNNIYSLALQKSDRSPEMILKLSDLMRYMLYECNVARADLQKDIQFIQDYIDLEKLRHGNDADIQLEITGDASGKKIPPLLLIPFIENAFKHGLNAQFGNAWVHIKIEIPDSGGITLLIENNKPHQPLHVPVKTGGIGIENARKRLSLLYPGQHMLSVKETETEFSVTLQITQL